MKTLFALLLLISSTALSNEIHPKIDYAETKYKKVAATTTCTTGGTVIPNGQKVALHRFRANGADPSAYVALIWDYGGGSEKIFASTKGDIDIHFDENSSDNQITGDGVKAIKVVIINDNTTQSPIIGGSYEIVIY